MFNFGYLIDVFDAGRGGCLRNPGDMGMEKARAAGPSGLVVGFLTHSGCVELTISVNCDYFTIFLTSTVPLERMLRWM